MQIVYGIKQWIYKIPAMNYIALKYDSSHIHCKNDWLINTDFHFILLIIYIVNSLNFIQKNWLTTVYPLVKVHFWVV
jgi:hypothetical protein